MCFNSVIAKFTRRKRINFDLNGGYQGRCAAADVSFYAKAEISIIETALTGNTSGSKAKEI